MSHDRVVSHMEKSLYSPGDVIFDSRVSRRVLIVKKSREEQGGRRGWEGFVVRRAYPDGFRLVFDFGSVPKRIWGYRRDVNRVVEEDPVIHNLEKASLYPREERVLNKQ